MEASIIDYIKQRSVDVENVINYDLSSFCTIYLTPKTYLYFRKRLGLIDKADGVRFDGMLVRWMLKLFLVEGGGKLERQSFDMTSLAPMVFEYCVQKKKSIFFAGASQGEIDIFVDKVRKMFPGIRVADYCHGYLEDREIEGRAKVSKADVIVLGVGNVRQEVLACRIRSNVKGLCFTCGAFISQTANSDSIHYYPHIIDKLNLRWIYRMLTSRDVLFRVIKYYPTFIFFFLKDVLFYRIKKAFYV